MALGKNMKVDRLIPLKGEKNDPIPNIAEDKSVKEEVSNDTSSETESTPNVSVSLDDFFESLNQTEPELENTTEVKNTIDEEQSFEVTPPITPEPVVSEQENADPSANYQDVEKEDFKLIFKPSRRKTQRRMIITIEGNLTIRNVELLHSKVHDVFDHYDFAEINLSNITDIDLTVVQLFHAIRVHFYPLNKFISINADLSREDRKLLNTCGFTEFNT